MAMIRSNSNVEVVVRNLKSEIRAKGKLVEAYEIETPEFDRLVPEYFQIEV